MKRTPLNRKGGSLKRTPLDKGDSALAARSSLSRGDKKLNPGKGLQSKTPLSSGNKPLSQSSSLKSKTPLSSGNKPLQSKGPMKSTPKPMTAEEELCRKIVKERSEGLCEVCGKRRATDMAHRLARSQNGKWTPSNILHACRDCHEGNHDNPLNAFENGWHLRSGSDPLECPVLLASSNGEQTWYLLKNDGSKVRHS